MMEIYIRVDTFNPFDLRAILRDRGRVAEGPGLNYRWKNNKINLLNYRWESKQTAIRTLWIIKW